MIMKNYVVLFLFLALTASISADEDLSVINPITGTSIPDNIKDLLKSLITDDMFVAKEIKCLVYEKHCSPIFSPIFKRMLHDALFNDCKYCSADQKDVYNIIKPVLTQEKFAPHLKLVIDQYHPSKTGQGIDGSRFPRSVESIHEVSGEKCEPGHYGNPLNATCQPCTCNGHATDCDSTTGQCLCTTRGITGDHCDRCDEYGLYEGDPTNGGTCFYELAVDYQFTFEFNEKKDQHHKAINYKVAPSKPDVDAKLNIVCTNDARMNVTFKESNDVERQLLSDVVCSKTSFEYNFSKEKYHFGRHNGVPRITIFVYVYDLCPPLKIQVAFAQQR